jgi:tripartite-type tricarboxylate transporter receptor subunit TctC
MKDMDFLHDNHARAAGGGGAAWARTRRQTDGLTACYHTGSVKHITPVPLAKYVRQPVSPFVLSFLVKSHIRVIKPIHLNYLDPQCLSAATDL